MGALRFRRAFGFLVLAAAYNFVLKRSSMVVRMMLGTVARHYDVKRSKLKVEEVVLGARRYHNFCKCKLLGEAFECQKEKVRYLDLACGSGGDISKINDEQVSSYFGVDISPQAVERAVDRLNKSKISGDVICFNAFSATFGYVLDNLRSFDIVSCQFALHYAFSDSLTAGQTIRNVSSALKPGGNFVVTIADSKYLEKSRRILGPKFANQFYSVKFENMLPFEDFGTKYSFSFKGSVDALDEYVVSKDVLVRLCNEYGLILKNSWNFSLHKNAEADVLWRTFNPVYSRFSDLYSAYIFTKAEE